MFLMKMREGPIANKFPYRYKKGLGISRSNAPRLGRLFCSPSLCCVIFRGRMLSKIHPHDTEFTTHAVIDDKLSKAPATALTVWKKSLVFSCNGFTVFDSTGNLVFRVDNYPSDPNDEILLMDAAGIALLTMRRKVYRHILYLSIGFLIFFSFPVTKNNEISVTFD